MDDHTIREAIREVWDHSSMTFDNIPGHQIGTSEERKAWARELFRNLPVARLRVLDIGCGTCAMGLLFSDIGHYVTGIDLSREMIKKARIKAEKSGSAIELLTGDAEHLPFDDGSIDIIVTRHLLWTLPHPEVALKEWLRILIPGGRLIVIDGIWNDKRISTRIKMCASSWMSCLLEPEKTHGKSYDKTVRSQLPYEGGVPKETIFTCLERTGFFKIHYSDLMYIREIQKQQMPWYKRFVKGKSYYLVHSKKPERIEP